MQITKVIFLMWAIVVLFQLQINAQDKYDKIAFPVGGMEKIASKITYPEEAKQNNISGKVFVQATVDETGTVVNAKILKGIGHGCDESALNAVKQTKFTPGELKGSKVKTEVTIPVVFKLDGKKGKEKSK